MPFEIFPFTLQVTESNGGWMVNPWAYHWKRKWMWTQITFMHSSVFTFSLSFTNVISKRRFMRHVKLISSTWCVNEKMGKKDEEKNESKIYQVNVCANEHMFVECCTFLGAFFCPFYKVSTWDCVSPFLWAVFTVYCLNCTNCMDVWRESYSYMNLYTVHTQYMPHFASLVLLFLFFRTIYLMLAYQWSGENVWQLDTFLILLSPLSHCFIHFPFTFLFFIAVQHHLSCSVRITDDMTENITTSVHTHTRCETYNNLPFNFVWDF